MSSIMPRVCAEATDASPTMSSVHVPRTAHIHLRERVRVLVLATIAVDAVCALIAYFAERDAHGTGIHSFGTAAFWTTTQLLTVSSQMPNPLTTVGRVLDVGMEIYAMTAVTALAGMFGAFFHHRSKERNAQVA
jgi:hypothetical protein